MNRRTAIRWWTLTGLLVAVIAWADYVGVMADEDTGTVALPPLEARIANWNAITGTPTTVAGYGITDGATMTWVSSLIDAVTGGTNEPLWKAVSNSVLSHYTNTVDNPHGITPEMIGAATGTPLYAESDPLYTGAVTRAGFTVSEGTSNAWDDATQTLSIKTNYIDEEADPNWAANSNAVMSHVADTNTNPHGITRAMIGAAYTGDVVLAISANGTTNTPDGNGLIVLGTIGGDNTTTVTGKQIKVGSELNVTPDYGYAIGKRSGVTADNGIALGYRASVTSQNSFVWSDASSESAFNSPGSNTFSVRASGGTYIDTPTFEITGYAIIGSDGQDFSGFLIWDNIEKHYLRFDYYDLDFYFGPTNTDLRALWSIIGNTNVWRGRINDTEASRIAALGTPGSGWTNLAFSGSGNAITNAAAAGTTLTLERGTVTESDPLYSAWVTNGPGATNAILADGRLVSIDGWGSGIPPDGLALASVAAFDAGTATIDLGSNWCWRLVADTDCTAINFSTASVPEGDIVPNTVKAILLEVSRSESAAWAWGGHLSHITNDAPAAGAVSHLLLIAPSQDVTATNGWTVF